MPEENSQHLRTILTGSLSTPAMWGKLAIAACLVLLLILLFPRGESIELDYRVGAVWARADVAAPFSFPVYRDESDYNSDLQAAQNNIIPVFERDENAIARQLSDLDTLLSRTLRHIQITPSYGPGDSTQASALFNVVFTEQERMLISRIDSYGGLGEMRRVLAACVQEYLSSGYIGGRKDSLHGDQIALRRGTMETVLPLSLLYDKNDIVTQMHHRLEELYHGDNDTTSLAYKIGISVIRPNTVFNRKATDLALRAAMDAVPRTLGFVQEGEKIVRKNERISAETRMKLESLRRARADRSPESGGITQSIGVALHVGVLILLYGSYLFLFRKRIFGNPVRLGFIALLIAFEGVCAFLSRTIAVNAPLEFLILVPAASMLLTIVFDSRVGFYGTVVIAFLVAGIRGNDYSVAFATLIAGSLSVYTVRDLKNRTQIFRSIGFIFLGYVLVILALGLERYASMSTLVEELALALTNAIVSAVLTYGLLIIVERTFKVTTDLTLIELAHFNHPLIRRLAEKAPGTYHHSMNMASMAEAAALAVDGNAVLARAGAFFHDVGKIKKPAYFVENQKGTRNRHDKLAPRMSSLIISAHVKDGMALARESKLPEEVVEFIPMHHGTTRMEYFYQKARRLAESSGDETKIDEINEQDYRYAGPKPQTKETGILMLADAIEASVRTLDDPSPQRLEALIDELVKKRFEEGELDECPLTLKDLTKIKAAFLGVLAGTYHGRVKYPEPEKKPRVSRRKEEPPVTEPEERPDVEGNT